MRKIKLFMFLTTALFIGQASVFSQTKFKLDPGHTLIQFNVERFMVGEVSGSFLEFEGEVTLDQDNTRMQQAQVSIQTGSLNTNHEVRDGHLKGEMWLNASGFPEITFSSKRVWQEGGNWKIAGDLTIKGTSNEVEFPFELKGPFKDPTGANTIGLSGDLTINRQDYGITFSKLMDNGELFIGNEVIIKIRALAIAAE